TVLSLSTNNSEALNGLGLARAARNRYDDAAKFFAAAIQAQPDFAPARLNLAIVDEEHLGDDKAALQNYIGYLSLPNPENRDAVNARIAALESPGKVAMVNPQPPKETETVSEPAPNPQPVVNSRPTQTTRPQMTRTNPSPQIIRIQPEPAIISSPRNAELSRNYNNGGVTPLITNPAPKPKLIQPAPPVFPRYLYLSPRKPKTGDHKSAIAAFTQAHQFEVSQDWADAANAYEKAAALDPAWFEAQYNFGVLAYRQRNYNRALAADEMALAIQPDSVAARYNFALALKAAGYATDAVIELKKIIAKDSSNVEAHLALGNLYAQQLRDAAQAREHYLKVLALDPRNPSASEIQFWLAANPQ